MNALPATPGGTSGVAVPVTPSTQTAPTGDAAFAGVLDRVVNMPGKPTELADASTRKPAQDAAETPAKKHDGTDARGGKQPQAPSPLDIAALAQAAAATALTPATIAAPAAGVAPAQEPADGVALAGAAAKLASASASLGATDVSAKAPGALASSSDSKAASTGSLGAEVAPTADPVSSAKDPAAARTGAASGLPAPSGKTALTPDSGVSRPSPVKAQAPSAARPDSTLSTASPAAASKPQTDPRTAGEPARAATQDAPATAGINAVHPTEPGGTATAISVAPKAAAATAPGTAAQSVQVRPPATTPGGVTTDGGSANRKSDDAPDRSPTDGRDEPSANLPPTTAPTTAAATDPVAGLLASSGTPAQQVSGALANLVADTRAARSAGSSATAAPTSATMITASAVKTLTLELNPDHLGPVSITLRLQADAMDIRIAVSTPQALHQLEQDKHVLSAAVAALGGTTESLHLVSHVENAMQPSTIPSNFDRPSGFSADTASTGRQSQGQSRQNGTTERAEPDDTTAAPAPHVLDGSLYV